MILPLLFAAAVAASASASARPAPSAARSAAPPVATATAPLPAGHPSVQPRSPHGGGAANLFRPPADTSDEDPKLPRGAIRIELRDPLEHVIAHRAVELGIVHQSIAKGDTHEHRNATTGDDGFADFSGLETDSGFAYRVTVHEADATYAATPFRLPHDHGMHVVLHVYPVMHELPRTPQVGARCVLALELKDDRLQLEERIDIYNGTTAAWVPHDLVLRLPDGFTALNGMQQMNDVGVDAVPGQGARIHGTFPPGDNVIDFTWQLPYGGQESLDFELGLPPAVRQAFVQAAATGEMKLEVAGFQETVVKTSQEGQRLLVTGKQLNDNEPPLRTMHIVFRDLPTPGPSRFVATILAMAAIAAGVYIAAQRRTRGGTKAAFKRDKDRILEEIDELEVAHERGEVGPKTYERARRELVDELAGLLVASK